MTFFATLASEPSGLAALSIELPNWITPSIAGLTVGAVVGVVGFVAVLFLVGRPHRPPQRRAAIAPSPDNIVYIPPYATLPRDTPVPAPWMGQQHPSSPPGAFPAAPPSFPVGASGAFPVAPNRGAPPLRPSTELSARVFAKMGYAVDAPPQTLRSEPLPAAAPVDAPSADPELELDESELQPEEELAVNHPVTVAPVMIVAAPPPQETLVMASSPLAPSAGPQPSARRSSYASLPAQPPAQLVRESAPAIDVSSSAMRMKAASIADLDLDDDAKTQLKESAFDEQQKRGASIADLDLEDNGATQICETVFDEPPQPRRRSEPPRIRPKVPSPPRFPAASAASLPRVTTPPPGRVRQA